MKLEKPLHRLSAEEKEKIIKRIRKTLKKRSKVCFAASSAASLSITW